VTFHPVLFLPTYGPPDRNHQWSTLQQSSYNKAGLHTKHLIIFYNIFLLSLLLISYRNYHLQPPLSHQRRPAERIIDPQQYRRIDFIMKLERHRLNNSSIERPPPTCNNSHKIASTDTSPSNCTSSSSTYRHVPGSLANVHHNSIDVSTTPSLERHRLK
jgi:hypothetical protein